jgi:purine-binding chemotaxis protein CheW
LASFTSIPTIPEEQHDERPRVLVVSVVGQLCALPIELVREVIRPKSITPIPGAPAVASGLVNVRGMVVTVLDLAAALRLDGVPLAEAVTERASGEPLPRAVVPSSIVLLEHGSRVVGVAVDAVHDVRPLDAGATSAGEEAFAESGSSGPDSADAAPRIARGVASAGDDIVMRLDLGALLARVMLSSEEGP